MYGALIVHDLSWSQDESSDMDHSDGAAAGPTSAPSSDPPRKVIYYASPNPQCKANTAYLVASYAVRPVRA